MPVISRTDKKSVGGRMTISLMYAFLLAGSVAMVYPFLLMIAGSTKSAVDATDHRIIPRFLIDDLALYRKFIEGRYNETFDYYRTAVGGEARSFLTLQKPERSPEDVVKLWREFERETEMPRYFYAVSFMSAGQSRGVIPHHAMNFIAHLQKTYGRTEAEVSAAIGTPIRSWSAFDFRPQNFYIRGQLPREDGLARAYRAWQAGMPAESRIYFNVTGQFRVFLRNQFGNEISGYNRERGTNYESYDAIPLAARESETVGLNAAEKADREMFIREILNPLWIRMSPDAVAGWREYLAARHGSIGTFNELTGMKYGSFEEVPLDESLPGRGQLLIDWNAYLQGWKDPETGQLFRVPVGALELVDAQFLFRDYLVRKLRAGSAMAGVGGEPAERIEAPFAALDSEVFERSRSAIKWEFMIRNYRSVWGYLAVNGRGIMNTLIFCSLAVGCALIFNPIAAYALSRFRPPLTYKLLLFLMLTMAFPPMVTQIPVFLMLRKFELLNTFAALILPGLANGYSIFLLKGFFDSLPRELYESSEIDGASEWVIFWQITMSLSKPILAVIALGAFTGAYSAFMFALLLCQDQSMWTIMVWLYQLQQRSGEGVVFASLLIAAVPTLAVFLLAQKVIMRGIAVPVEK